MAAGGESPLPHPSSSPGAVGGLPPRFTAQDSRGPEGALATQEAPLPPRPSADIPHPLRHRVHQRAGPHHTGVGTSGQIRGCGEGVVAVDPLEDLQGTGAGPDLPEGAEKDGEEEVVAAVTVQDRPDRRRQMKIGEGGVEWAEGDVAVAEEEEEAVAGVAPPLLPAQPRPDLGPGRPHRTEFLLVVATTHSTATSRQRHHPETAAAVGHQQPPKQLAAGRAKRRFRSGSGHWPAAKALPAAAAAAVT